MHGPLRCACTAGISMTDPSPPGPLEPVTIKLDDRTLAEIAAIKGDGTRSDAIRTLISFGLRHLQDPHLLDALELHHLLGQLEAVAAQFPGGHTPSGARWCPTPDHLPEPGTVKNGEVLATGGGVIVAAVGGIITADLAGEQLTISSDAGQRWSHPLDLPALGQLATALSGALLQLAHRPGGRARLPLGLELERTEAGGLLLEGGGLSVALDGLTGFRLAAELHGLLAGTLAPRLAQRQQLEHLIAAPGAEVER